MAAADTLLQSPAIRQMRGAPVAHEPRVISIPKSGALVLWGFGIKVRLDQNHFFAEWGVGMNRYQVRLSRVEGRKLKRVILLGSDGYISLESLRFITEVNASFSLIDRRGKVLMVCSPVAPSDSKIRRSQSLAITNGVGLAISKEIISEKLAAQAALVRGDLHNDAAADAIERIRKELRNTQSLERLRFSEAAAGKINWSAWSDVPVMWTKKDGRRIPDRWRYFGQRISELTHSPRLATNPPNTLLNFLYCLLENETRIAIVAMGLDPGIGLLHVDAPNRDSLVFDLMEVCRPKVDAFVLHWLQTEAFRKSDWFESRDGSCRMITSLAIKLCQTSNTWQRLINPWAEWLSLKLYESTIPARSHFSRNVVRVTTRLTQSHRRAAKGSEVPAVAVPAGQHVCAGCGAIPVDKRRNHCQKCGRRITIRNFRKGRKFAQSPESRARRAATQSKQRALNREFDPATLPEWLTQEFYTSRIVPALTKVPKVRIRSILGISEPYATIIQSGKRIPHARHWPVLAKLAGIAV